VDSGAAAASSVKQLLTEKGLRNRNTKKGESKFYVSDETHNFTATANVFLGEEIKNITKINVGCQ